MKEKINYCTGKLQIWKQRQKLNSVLEYKEKKHKNCKINLQSNVVLLEWKR